MKPFRDLPIQRKMLLMTLLICGSVLCVAIAALFTFQILNFRSNFQRDTATLAAVIADNSTAALAFKDANGGAEVMRSLQARPTVVSASLVLPNGDLFARFGKAEDARTLSQFPPAGKSLFTGEDLLHTQPVVLEKKQLGTLYLRSDFQRTFVQLLSLYALVVAGVMIVSIGLAVLLSSRLRRIITDPILRLAGTAQAVGEKKDYSLRVTAIRQGDELGRLTESFNEMLSRIQTQDQALKESRERFEIAIAGANDGIWDWNLKTNEIFLSHRWKSMIGYADGEIQNTLAAWDSLMHPEDRGAARALWEALGESIGAHYGLEPSALRLGRQDRISAKGVSPLRDEVAVWTGALGLGAIELYQGGPEPKGVVPLPAQTPILVLGGDLASPLTAAALFALGRAVFRLRRGTAAIHGREADEVGALLYAAVRMVDPQAPAPPLLRLAEYQTSLPSSVSRKLRKGLAEPARAFATGPDHVEWVLAERHSANRAGALFASDLMVSIALVAGGPADDAGLRRSREAMELVRFLLSPEHLALRRELGLAIP